MEFIKTSACTSDIPVWCRYFAETAATLVTRVFGKRVHRASPTAPAGFDYWITDGLYGSMNNVLYDHAVLSARPLRCPTLPAAPTSAQQFSSIVFGPSCDGLDVVLTVSATSSVQVCTLRQDLRVGQCTSAFVGF